DPRTFRMTRLCSEAYTQSDATGLMPVGPAMQDWTYVHDLVGNPLSIEDRALDSGIINNPDALLTDDAALAQLLAGGQALRRRFAYDALYRLIRATGREGDVPDDGTPWLDGARCTDLSCTRGYVETYTHDSVSNMVRLDHRANGVGFTRVFDISADSNRL